MANRQEVPMEVEMTIRGLLMDPVYEYADCGVEGCWRGHGVADLGGGLRGECDCAGDGEGQHAAAR